MGPRTIAFDHSHWRECCPRSPVIGAIHATILQWTLGGWISIWLLVRSTWCRCLNVTLWRRCSTFADDMEWCIGDMSSLWHWQVTVMYIGLVLAHFNEGDGWLDIAIWHDNDITMISVKTMIRYVIANKYVGHITYHQGQIESPINQSHFNEPDKIRNEKYTLSRLIIPSPPIIDRISRIP